VKEGVAPNSLPKKGEGGNPLQENIGKNYSLDALNTQSTWGRVSHKPDHHHCATGSQYGHCPPGGGVRAHRGDVVAVEGGEEARAEAGLRREERLARRQHVVPARPFFVKLLFFYPEENFPPPLYLALLHPWIKRLQGVPSPMSAPPHPPA